MNHDYILKYKPNSGCKGLWYDEYYGTPKASSQSRWKCDKTWFHNTFTIFCTISSFQFDVLVTLSVKSCNECNSEIIAIILQTLILGLCKIWLIFHLFCMLLCTFSVHWISENFMNGKRIINCNCKYFVNWVISFMILSIGPWLIDE